jgi:hypothetical protein
VRHRRWTAFKGLGGIGGSLSETGPRFSLCFPWRSSSSPKLSISEISADNAQLTTTDRCQFPAASGRVRSGKASPICRCLRIKLLPAKGLGSLLLIVVQGRSGFGGSASLVCTTATLWAPVGVGDASMGVGALQLICCNASVHRKSCKLQ